MPRHSRYSNLFIVTVNKTKQRYSATIPKPIAEVKEIIGGRFTYNPKTNKLNFKIEDIEEPLIIHNEHKEKKN